MATPPATQSPSQRSWGRQPEVGARRRLEYLYVIQATNLEGLMIYSKGKLIADGNQDRVYFLVSGKRAL